MVEQRSIPLYLSQPHPCGYLPDRLAQTAFIPEGIQLSCPDYEALLQQGFRRSGNLVYRPQCADCQACIACRVAIDTFKRSRSQRRVCNKNSDLTVKNTPARYDAKHYELYLCYQHARHGDSEMASFSEQDYRHFICDTMANAFFLECYDQERLVAVAVTDRLERSLSAVYTFFDPEASARSLGTFAILQQIELARRLNKQFLYLGYTIEACPKMRYKADFKPLQRFQNNHWSSEKDNLQTI